VIFASRAPAAEQFDTPRVRPLNNFETDDGRSSLLEREYHPEWGILTWGRHSVRTVRLAAVATAIGAVIGSAIVFSTRPSEDFRSLVPKAIATRSSETSDRSQQVPKPLPSSLPSVSNIDAARAPFTATASLSSDHSNVHAIGEDKLHSNPTSDETTSHETVRPQGVNRTPDQSSPPIAKEAARRPKLPREPQQTIATRRELMVRPRHQEVRIRRDDVSAFFRPWWYAYPKDWQRIGG
jgi:hypothetical protein